MEIVILEYWGSYHKQDQRWNADKPSAALDPYIQPWLWKVLQSQVGLMKTNFKCEAPILWFFTYK